MEEVQGLHGLQCRPAHEGRQALRVGGKGRGVGVERGRGGVGQSGNLLRRAQIAKTSIKQPRSEIRIPLPKERAPQPEVSAMLPEASALMPEASVLHPLPNLAPEIKPLAVIPACLPSARSCSAANTCTSCLSYCVDALTSAHGLTSPRLRQQ